MPFQRPAVLAFLVGLSLLNPASAHNLDAEVQVLEVRFQVHAHFEDGTSVGNATAEVKNTAGETVTVGRTDDQGIFTFSNPLRDRLEIVVEDDTGHRETFPLSPAAIALAIKGEAAKLEHTHGEGGHSHDGEDDHDHHHEEAEHTHDDPESTDTESGLTLTKPDQGSRSGKVISGLGYVLGITGILFYLLGLRQRS